jgi:hypothetical protein
MMHSRFASGYFAVRFVARLSLADLFVLEY